MLYIFLVGLIHLLNSSWGHTEDFFIIWILEDRFVPSLFFLWIPFLLIVPSGLIFPEVLESHPSHFCFSLSFCFNLRTFLDALITEFSEFNFAFWGQDLYAIKNTGYWFFIFASGFSYYLFYKLSQGRF